MPNASLRWRHVGGAIDPRPIVISVTWTGFIDVVDLVATDDAIRNGTVRVILRVVPCAFSDSFFGCHVFR